MFVTRPRLLLIEGDPALGSTMERALDEVYDVTRIDDGGRALISALDGAFDVMIVDRELSVDGISVVEAFRRAGVRIPMLMLTTMSTVQDKVRGLDAGSSDYLVKPFELDELFARLRAIRRVDTGEGPFVRIGPWEFYPESRAVYSPYDGRVILTDRECEMLTLFAANPQRTFDRSEILSAVFDAGDTPGTIDTYVHYLRRKTDVGIITTVRGRGYRLGML